MKRAKIHDFWRAENLKDFLAKEETLVSKIFRIVPEAKKGVIISLFIGIAFEIIKFAPVILVKNIIDALITGENGLTKISYLVAGILVSYISMNIIDFFAKRKQHVWINLYEAEILRKAKLKLLEMHLAFHESYNTGAQVSKISKGAHKLAELLWFTFNEFIPTIIQLGLTLVLLLYEQWILALIFVLFMPVVLLLTFHSSKSVQYYRRLYHQKHDEAIGELGESLFNISTVKNYVQEKKQFHKFNFLLGQFLKSLKKRVYVGARIDVWRDIFITLGRAGTLGVAIYMVLDGIITPGTLVMVYSLTERAFLSTFRISRLFSYLEDAMESIDRLASLLQEKPLVKNMPGAESLKELKGDIEFRDLTFSYGKGELILKNIQLSIKPKQTIALVGRSGSGKSTLVKLLLRNYDVKDGEVLVDGRNIKHYRIEDYKKRIAVVSQDVEVFNRSILENILFANPSAAKEQAMEAAKNAYAHKFIKDLPEGYDTVIGEKGVRLSGGQKQRLSIARALLKNPDIFIFDEATSSLDSESEQFIQRSIFSIAGKKTTIIIAHRLSTIKLADVIVVMDKGRIVEKGTYNELVKKDGHFARMINLQNIGIRK